MRRELAIAIPAWKDNITTFEEISLLQCCSILRKYTFYLVTFKDLDVTNFVSIFQEKNINYKFIFFSEKNFLNTERYSRMLLSVKFYIRFICYKYILICQLDCFVFRDELQDWIDAEYSYIGAPWVQGYDAASYGNAVIGVGNGGLSLRRVKDHLRVLLSFSRIKRNNFSAEDGHSPLHTKILSIFKRALSNNSFFLFNTFQENEDIFWSDVAGKNFSWFKIPDWKTAARFSVEVQPRYFFELNEHTLPFGCHAWWRYDLAFWKPHIEKFGYQIPPLPPQQAGDAGQ